MDDILKQFDTQVWRTKGARFNAYRRLIRKHYASIFTISLLSLYNIGLNLVPYTSFKGLIVTDDLATSSIFISVFILILSLLEFAKGYEVKAERLHNNAMELSEFYSELQLEKSKNAELNVSLTKKYHAIIKSCPENHSPQDDDKFKTEHPHEFDLHLFSISLGKDRSLEINKLRAYLYIFKYHLDTYWLYLVLIISPVALLLFA